jgi:membrane-bound lytic murein transglycosylase A
MTDASADPADRFPASIPNASVTGVEPSALAGWQADDTLAAWRVFQDHCRALLDGRAPLRAGLPPPPALLAVCRKGVNAKIASASEARQFFEQNFSFREVTPDSGRGFLTGYHEPEVEGSLTQTAEFSAPLLARPDDVATIPQGETLPGIPADFAAARRKPDGTYEIYPDRSVIMAGGLGGLAKPIIWLRDDTEVFFMQVQGSGKVRLRDGSVRRIAYAGRNGHPYTSIGRAVVQQGLLKVEDASADKLKVWLRADVERGRKIMALNRSYVFFRIADELPAEAGPIGGAGLPLTPWRSIAIDRNLWPYGLPVWLETELPDTTGGASQPFRQLMVAQDTGSAILGAARADLFFGSGDEAEARASIQRHPMRFIVLWPKTPVTPQ